MHDTQQRGGDEVAFADTYSVGEVEAREMGFDLHRACEQEAEPS